MRRITSLALITLLFSLISPVQAQASILDKIVSWFKPPQEHEGPRPDETLRAPFVDNEASGNNKLMRIYNEADLAANTGLDESQSADIRKLSVAHRTEGQITEWATNVVATALNFSMQELKNFAPVLRPSFSASAIQNFKSFLTRADIVRKLQNDKYRLASYISSQPQIVQKGTAEDIYYWVVDVPVELSYLPLNGTNKARINPSSTQSGTIRIQIQRTDNTQQFVQGMSVTRWTAKELKKTK